MFVTIILLYFHAVSGQTLEVEVTELSQGLKVILPIRFRIIIHTCTSYHLHLYT